jgi:hypothetical protein
MSARGAYKFAYLSVTHARTHALTRVPKAVTLAWTVLFIKACYVAVITRNEQEGKLPVTAPGLSP